MTDTAGFALDPYTEAIIEAIVLGFDGESIAGIDLLVRRFPELSDRADDILRNRAAAGR